MPEPARFPQKMKNALMISLMICVGVLRSVVAFSNGNMWRGRQVAQYQALMKSRAICGGSHNPSSADALRQMISAACESQTTILMPCCYDGLSARLVERAGFNLTFMTGFGVSAVHGLPDTQLLSYGEMVESARVITSSLRAIPCIGDGDTGKAEHTTIIP